MSKSDVLLGLIKEVVKNEVKQQVKEEIVRLVKSGAITLNSSKPKSTTPSLKEAIQIDPFEKANKALQNSRKVTPTQPQKEFTKNPVINEILNQTSPFTAAHRAEGAAAAMGMGGGSILDAIQPQRSMEDDWETLSYSNDNMPSHQIPSTDNAGVDVLTKALTRDYSELVKRFNK
jgi:hypothetical protein